MNKAKNGFYITEFYAVFVFVMALLVVAIAIYTPKSVKSPAVSPAPIPPVQKDITVEKRDDGTKLVKNVKEGFNVVLPKGFGVNEKTYSSSSVLTFYGGEGETACKIEVYVGKNKDGLSLKDWVERGNEDLDRNLSVTKNEIEKIDYNDKEYYKQVFNAAETGEILSFFFEKGDRIIEVVSYVDDTSYVCDNNIEQIAKSIE